MYLLTQRVRREEKIIETLEAEIHHHPVTPAPAPTPVATMPVATPMPAPVVLPAINPQLALYIKNMHKLNQSDEQIQKALTVAGYKVPDILAALAVK